MTDPRASNTSLALMMLYGIIGMLADIEEMEQLLMIPTHHFPRVRRPSRQRQRYHFTSVTEHLSDSEFRRAFRMSRRAFYKLLALLLPHLQRDEVQAARSSSGAIEPAVRLAVTLRMLSGCSYLDQMLSFRLGRSTVFYLFRATIRAIRDTLTMPGIPTQDAEKLRILADGFACSRSAPNPLYGCVGALDGIAIQILKPDDLYVPRNFYCRKVMYALPVQAVADSRLRFSYMSCPCSGSTHDSVAFSISALARNLREVGMVAGFWIAADPAYLCKDSVLTPWSKDALRGSRGVYCDSFNFFQSSHRIHVEQAFGVLVQRWGILWRPLAFGVPDCLLILSAAMRLHNYCIDEDGLSYFHDCESPYNRELASEAFRVWWNCATAFREENGNDARRRDLEVNVLREALTSSLENRGITRPATT